jgi:hypothetical protein
MSIKDIVMILKIYLLGHLYLKVGSIISTIEYYYRALL